MKKKSKWSLWTGAGYPSRNGSTVYFRDGMVDVEEGNTLLELVKTMVNDGVVSSKEEGERAVDTAVVLHGESYFDGQKRVYKADDTDSAVHSQSTTWVEVVTGA